MQNTYVIDAYNLMHAMGILTGKVKPLGLARARLQFQEFLVSAFGAEAGQVTVVFDAPVLPGMCPGRRLTRAWPCCCPPDNRRRTNSSRR